MAEADLSGLDGGIPAEADRGWTSIDRIIAKKADKLPMESQAKQQKKLHTTPKTEYLVKWQGLPYDEASWETAEDLEKLSAADFAKELARFKDRGPIGSKQAFQKVQVRPNKCLLGANDTCTAYLK